MTSLFDEIIKKIPPEVISNLSITDYSSTHISIIKIGNALATPTSSNFYKFLLPLTNKYPPEILDNQEFQLKKDHLLPINPGQYHCSEIKEKSIIKISPLLIIFVEKKFLNKIAKSLYGKQNIIFENYNYYVSSLLKNLINIFIEETITKPTGYKLILKNLEIQIVINIFRITENYICKNNLNKKNYELKYINTVINYLKNNYNQELTLEKIANQAHYSPCHFIRIFKAETGKTPFEYLINIRINRAKEMLKNTNKPIIEICLESGFNNRSHFSTVFKRKTGYSPSIYRKIIK